ncbi:MAG: TIGR03617 family F420-dependent LLM class oxidoreductase [Proteobacteria bacterium]|jgi:probable F420-dependent oxidoreductase|nr:TIGR03617 family F420-dependent LLM class oxidoreductase [Pseudomonadota bacterium]
MEIFAVTPEGLGLQAIGGFAQRVEAMGYDGLFVPDAVHDGLLMALQALAHTRRIKVGISVLVAPPRSPMNVALAAWDLQKFSGGRFELGLGTQIRQNVEGRYSARWLPPAAAMREYVGALRAIFRSFRSGARLEYVGEHYRFTRLQPFFNPGPIDAPDVPIMLGAVGPKMLALAGEVADGLHAHPTNTSGRYLREVVLPRLGAGAAKRDASVPAPLVCACTLVATGPDAATVARERERLAGMLGFLFSTPAYWPSLQMFGWPALGEQLLQLTRQGQWQQMRNLLTDPVLDEFLVCATYDELPDALASRYAGLAGRITLSAPEHSADDAAHARAIHAIRRRVAAAAQGGAHAPSAASGSACASR